MKSIYSSRDAFLATGIDVRQRSQPHRNTKPEAVAIPAELKPLLAAFRSVSHRVMGIFVNGRI
jgi:hypothetical protein